MTAAIRKNDIGTVFRGTVKDQASAVVNISTQTKLEMVFTKPGGANVVKTAVLSTNGTDGKMQYTSVANDLDTEGEWSFQGYVELAAGQKWHSDIHHFRVEGNLR
jgi:hypothetical protein